MTEQDTNETTAAATGDRNLHDHRSSIYSGSSRSLASHEVSLASHEVSIDLEPPENEEDTPIAKTISKKATKHVMHLKMLVIAILIISASSLAAFAKVFINKSETQQFESKFASDAQKVLEAIGSSIDKTLGLMDSVAVTMISDARDKGDIWPNVTLPDFGSRMAKLLPQTDAYSIAILPIVEPSQRKEWEAYSVQNDEWVNQSIAIQNTWDGYFGPILSDWEKYGTIHGDQGDVESNVRYAHAHTRKIRSAS